MDWFRKNLALIMLFSSLSLPTIGKAHTLLMNVNGNGDGTVTVEAIFSTGSAGAELPLETLKEKAGIAQ